MDGLGCGLCGTATIDTDGWRLRLRDGNSLVACSHQSWFEAVVPEDPKRTEFWLNGAGVGLREYARGRAVLHGSSLALGDIGVVVVGDARAGKSTLTAWLCRQGWRFVSDAFTAVDPATRELIPQRPRIRLYDDSLRALDVDPEHLSLDDTVLQKRRYDVADVDLASQGTRLRHVFVLASGSAVEVQELEAAEKAIELVRHAYLARNLDASRSPHLLRHAVNLVASGVTVHKLAYPKVWRALGEVDACLRDWIGRYGEQTTGPAMSAW
ncbi:MAG TPA: hypothetical protein VIV60_16140 [Polyangiaceae bacterium]